MKGRASCAVVRRTTLAAGLLLGAASPAWPPSQAAPTAPPQAGIISLDYAFRFASAIVTDPKDQAKAQEAVLQDLLRRLGATEEVLTRVDQVQGWRQGVLFADLAAFEAKAGRSEAARELIARAEGVRAATSGWQGPRIDAHIASALALMGDVKPAERIAEDLREADSLQYRGRAAWTIATGFVSRNEFLPAFQALTPLDGDGNLETAVWRTRGYVAIGQERRFSTRQRLQALEAALVSTRTMDGWSRVEALEEIAAHFVLLARNERARQALHEAEALARALPEPLPAKVTLIAELARSWRAAGSASRARDLLRQAEPAAGEGLDIDRPAAYARLASVRHDLGDAARARQLYDQAFVTAEALRNARPRALAAVEICRCLARNGIDPAGKLRTRLEALLDGLQDPW